MRANTRLLAVAAILLGLGLVSIAHFFLDLRSDSSPLVVTPSYVDLGSIEPGIHSVDVALKNQSGQKLSVQEVLLQCGCTSTSLSKDPLEPDGSRRFSVSWDTNGLSGASKTVMWVVYKFRDGEIDSIGRASLALSCNITPPIFFYPTTISLERLEPRKTIITFKASGSMEFKLKSARSSHKCLSVKVGEEGQSVLVDFQPSVNGGTGVSGVHRIVVETDVAGYSVLSVPVVVN